MANRPKKSLTSVSAAVSTQALERAMEAVPGVLLEPLPVDFAAHAGKTTHAAAVPPVEEAHATASTNTAPETPVEHFAPAQIEARALVETGLSETHTEYEKMTSAAEEAAQTFETSRATVKHSAAQYSVKALEALSESAQANFDFFRSMLAVKSPSEYVTLQAEFARKQIELMTAQTRAFGELAQRLAAETAEPIKAQVARAFNAI